MSTPTTDLVTTEGDASPPRPGLAKALGVSHIVIASLSSLALAVSLVWVTIAVASAPEDRESSSMMGLDEPRFVAFTLVDAVTGLIANGFTFASGVALFNLRAWGARVWRWLAPVKIARLLIVWGGFVIAVAPRFAANLGQFAVKFMAQANPGRKVFSAAEVSLVYAWMMLAMGIGMIVLGSIYPALTWWLVRRRGIQSALLESESASIPHSPSNPEAYLP